MHYFAGMSSDATGMRFGGGMGCDIGYNDHQWDANRK